MTIDEAIKWLEEQAQRKDDEAYLHCIYVQKEMLKKAEDYRQVAEWLECLNEIAHIFLEHRAWGEYPSSADDMWEETIRVLDKYKIEIKEQK